MFPTRRLVPILLALTFLPSPARAINWTVKLEPGAGIALTEPQSRLFGIGGGAAIKGGVSPLAFLDVGLALHLFGFSAERGDAPGALAVGANAGFFWPGLKWVAPWADVDFLYMRTGTLDRFAFSVGAGASFGLLERALWLGPYVRYMMVPAFEDAGHDGGAANLLFFGVSVAYGSKRPIPILDADHDGVPDEIDQCPKEEEDKDNFEDADGCPEIDNDKDGVFDEKDRCPLEPGSREADGCPDKDRDGVKDADDQCPEAAGKPVDQGCPFYKHVRVGKQKIEVDDKITFVGEKAEIQQRSFELLLEVAQALRDHAGIRIRVEVHVDSAGRTKSGEARATAIRDYLVQQGVDPNRVESQAVVDTAGRDRRRVEFVILE